MKIYIKGSINIPKKIKTAIEDTMAAVDSGRKVYVAYDDLIDKIINYTVLKSNDPIGEDTIIFNTLNNTNYFGSKVDLSAYSEVNCDDDGELFIVEVQP